MFTKILIPVEPEHYDASQKAIGVAAELAKQHGASVTMMTLAPFRNKERMVEAERDLAEFGAFVKTKGEELGLALKAAFRVADSVSDGIREVAEDIGADLVVMSSHDPVLTDYLFGSNAASVVLHTPCSVLVIR